jgi:regulator of sigma E protease
MKIIIPVLILSFIVFIHELGHFLAAIFFKFDVREFSLGFGPTIFKIEGKLSKYSIKAIPLGGFVDIKDMENGEWEKRKFIPKFIVLSSGVMMNFILAFVLLFSISIYLGHVNLDSNVVTKVVNNKAILKQGDTVLKIDNIDIKNWNEIKNNLKDIKDSFKIEVLRSKKLIKLNLSKESIENIVNYAIPIKNSIWLSFTKSLYTIFSVIKESLKSIIDIFVGKSSIENMSSVVGVFSTIKENVDNGIMTLLILTALISISVGFLNILPILPLDGGKILITTIEAIGIKINKKILSIIESLSVILILLLTVWIIKKDITKLSSRKKIENLKS